MNEMPSRDPNSPSLSVSTPSKSHSPRSHASFLSQRSLLVQGLGWLGGLGFLSGGIVWAEPQAPDHTLDTSATDLPSVIEMAPSVEYAPEFTEPSVSEMLEPAPVEPEWTPAEVAPVEEYIPEAVAPVEEYVPEAVAPVEEYAPEAAAPSYAPEQYQIQEAPVAAPVPAAEDYGAYIDSTDYSIGATETNTYDEPSRVILSERSTGCEAVLEAGEAVSGGVCGASPIEEPSAAPIAQSPAPSPGQSAPIPTWSPEQQKQPSIPKPTFVQAVAPASGSSQASSQPVYQEVAIAPAEPTVTVGPITVSSSGIQFGGTASSRAYFGLNRPMGRPGNGNASILFPLSIPAPITSIFGWRVHPIFGDSRFHSGTDLGAPMGTPVLAALAGKVAIADFMGGYGLTVVLEHNKASQETLYAHLSEIFVKPGEEIKQGAVIGRVGSTGNSTGPHLHFEMRERTADGWAYLDPGAQLEYALGQLVGVMQTAQANPQAKQAQEKANSLKQLIPTEKLPIVKIRS